MGKFRDRHIVAGYFPTVEQAETAGNVLKQWDKANDSIKLGGVGIVTADKGKIRTKHVGRRHTGPAAAWGMALGAVTGILSGGVTLIGGALAAGVAGGAGGALFRRHIGLSHQDKLQIETYLRNGGALLVAMADDDEVAFTEEKLIELGAITKNYQVPEETMERIEQAEDIQQIDEAELVPA